MKFGATARMQFNLRRADKPSVRWIMERAYAGF